MQPRTETGWNLRRLLPRTISHVDGDADRIVIARLRIDRARLIGTVVCSSRGIPISLAVHPRGVSAPTPGRNAFGNPERPAEEKAEEAGEDREEEEEKEEEKGEEKEEGKGEENEKEEEKEKKKKKKRVEKRWRKEDTGERIDVSGCRMPKQDVGFFTREDQAVSTRRLINK